MNEDFVFLLYQELLAGYFHDCVHNLSLIFNFGSAKIGIFYFSFEKDQKKNAITLFFK